MLKYTTYNLRAHICKHTNSLDSVCGISATGRGEGYTHMKDEKLHNTCMYIIHYKRLEH